MADFERVTTLHEDWHLALSPQSVVDTIAGKRPREASLEELDFVLVRLATPVGRDLIHGWERRDHREQRGAVAPQSV